MKFRMRKFWWLFLSHDMKRLRWLCRDLSHVLLLSLFFSLDEYFKHVHMFLWWWNIILNNYEWSSQNFKNETYKQCFCGNFKWMSNNLLKLLDNYFLLIITIIDLLMSRNFCHLIFFLYFFKIIIFRENLNFKFLEKIKL